MKTMTDLRNKTISEIAGKNIITTDVFKKYEIDFCCGGEKTLQTVCKEHDLNIDKVMFDLENVQTKRIPANLNFDEWGIEFLADYIVYVHHSYVKKNIDIINDYAEKVANAHGEKDPNINKIVTLFSKISKELKIHIGKEETELFPAIKAKAANPNFQFDKSILTLLKNQHDEVAIITKNLKKLTYNFTPPEWACPTLKKLYFKLEEFTNDLYQHVHLENNVLFAKVNEIN